MAATDADAPAVSVVIPTHERETRLAFALEALAAQTLDRDRFEVIVVRSRGARAPLAAAPAGLHVRFLEYEGESTRPAKRNHGWRNATGHLVAFTDDDCRPSPGWLEALVGCEEGDAVAIQGRTEPDPDEVHLLHGLARSITVTAPSPWYPTCNLALPRTLLERIGGFDEEFVATGEDTDLALRAIEAGAEFSYAEDALVWHAVLPMPLHRAVAEGWGRWDTTPLVFRRHPAHRRHLYRGLFFNRTHACVALVAAAFPFARRRPWLLALAAVPFTLDGFSPEGVTPRAAARQVAHTPSRFAAHAAQTAGMVRGGLRHRVPIV